MIALLCIIALLLVAVVCAAYLTNPFNRLTLIKQPYVATGKGGQLKVLDNNHRLMVTRGRIWKIFAVVKNGVHILSSRYVRSPRSSSHTVDSIIADIHSHRFNTEKLLLTSGDHFNALFVRNLGVFYYPMLDTSITSTEEDWHNRQVVYLQTVAYALGVYRQLPIATTTIVPTGTYRATCINFYAYPSDTVYGMLYALATLSGKEPASPAAYGQAEQSLHTVAAAGTLVRDYKTTLRELYEHYRRTVFDGETELIKQDLHLSGAKDITRRNCSFYDNVIFWKTTGLAMELGLTPTDKPFLAALKKRILKRFWLEDVGYFLEDLSEEGAAKGYYSSEWLIVLVTGFLHPEKANERRYYERCVSYIQKEGIDQPFPLKYHLDTRRHRQFFIVRLAVASYGGDAIWSFWGMEYIKLLLLLYKYGGERQYLRQADGYIRQYERNMLRDGGFAEVYSPDGALLQTPLYRSIRQTGWVIGFEQARGMRKSIADAARQKP